MIYKLFPVEKLMDFYTGLNYRSKSMSIIQGYRPVVVKGRSYEMPVPMHTFFNSPLQLYKKKQVYSKHALPARYILFNPTFVNAFGYAINKHGGTRRFRI